jgi:hypothetical protein
LINALLDDLYILSAQLDRKLLQEENLKEKYKLEESIQDSKRNYRACRAD